MTTGKSKASSKAVLPPPRTFEEFLVYQNVDHWPRFPHNPELDAQPLITKIKNDYTLNFITKNLFNNAPLPTEVTSSLGERMEECRKKVYGHANDVFSLEGSKEIDDQQIAILEQDVGISAVDAKKKEQLKIAVGVTKDTSCKKIENCKFPGFTPTKFTKLPNYLEPAQLWDAVIKVQTFRGMNMKVLKKLFLSEASVAILQDCFWWLFLQKFRPNKRAQNRLFDRIADSFVALLLNTPSCIKDRFFQTYPDCLSQAIYVSFCEAFPESYYHFQDKFKDDIMDVIFQWIRGFKPQKHAWKKWNLWWLERPTESTVQDSSQRMRHGRPKRLLSELMEKMKTYKYLFPEDEPPKVIEKPKRESHYIGDGPDFQRSLFNLGGQSPLVSYYLRMHGIANTLARSRAFRISHTEVCTIPTPDSPTYRDVIEENAKYSGKILHDFLKFDRQWGEELSMLEEKREKVDRQYRRILAIANTDRIEFLEKTEIFLKKMEKEKQRQANILLLSMAEKERAAKREKQNKEKESAAQNEEKQNKEKESAAQNTEKEKFHPLS